MEKTRMVTEETATAAAAGRLDAAVVVEGEGADKGAIKVNFRVMPYSNILRR